jgi:hypothetical protein
LVLYKSKKSNLVKIEKSWNGSTIYKIQNELIKSIFCNFVETITFTPMTLRTRKSIQISEVLKVGGIEAYVKKNKSQLAKPRKTKGIKFTQKEWQDALKIIKED